MSRCFYLYSDYYVPFDELQEMAQKLNSKGYTIGLKKFESDGFIAGTFYIEGYADCGVHVIVEEKLITVMINFLANEADFALAVQILDLLSYILEKEVYDEKGSVIVAREYFTDDKVQEFREKDVTNALNELKANPHEIIQFKGIVRDVYFGDALKELLERFEDHPEKLVDVFDRIKNHVQYGLPDYKNPEATYICNKDYRYVEEPLIIRSMFKGNPYILQDYDYLMIASNEENIFINNEDLLEIVYELFDENSGFSIVDDFTVVFPKLNGAKWKLFVDLARERNHKELLSA